MQDGERKGAALPKQIAVVPLFDPAVEADGYYLSSLYVELFWLPRLGPTSFALARNLERKLHVWPDGYELDCALTAIQLGVGHHQGGRSPFSSALGRLAANGFVEWRDEATLAVRRRVRRLPGRLAEQLPEALAVAHRRVLTGDLILN